MLIALARAPRLKAVSLVLVNVGEARRTVELAVQQRGYDVPVLLDEDGDAIRRFGVRATPTVMLVGRDGAVLGRAIGPRSWTGAAGHGLLEALLACRPRG